jgi:hypothetical protein
MNSVLFLLWASDISDTVGTVRTTIGILGALLGALSLIFYLAVFEARALIERHAQSPNDPYNSTFAGVSQLSKARIAVQMGVALRRVALWLGIVFVLLLPVPSSTTIQIMAAAQAGKLALDTTIGRDAAAALHRLLGKIAADTKEEAK